MINDTLIVIPIRMGSSRFPGKPLVDINGKAMIIHVWEKAIASKCGDVIVACCDNIVKNFLTKKNIPFVMTDKNLNSGTDRVYDAIKISLKNNSYKYVINLQGDIPNVNPRSIKLLTSIIKNKGVDMATLVSKINNSYGTKNKNIVKVAITKKDNFYKAIYFSRMAIPSKDKKYYEHIGIYAYTMSTLRRFVSLKLGDLEKVESLEQLRALENGINITAGIVSKSPFSIDTPGDLKNFIKKTRLKK